MVTYADVLDLSREIEGVVIPASFEDENGHMNIRHYFDLGARAISVVFARLGVTDDYRSTRGQGFFTAEHHVRYLSEIHVGERVSVHVRTLERSDKVIHAMAFLVNDTTRQLANTLEVITTHVDLTTRRVAPFAPDLAAAWDAELARAADLTWPAPTCGALGIRH